MELKPDEASSPTKQIATILSEKADGVSEPPQILKNPKLTINNEIFVQQKSNKLED